VSVADCNTLARVPERISRAWFGPRAAGRAGPRRRPAPPVSSPAGAPAGRPPTREPRTPLAAAAPAVALGLVLGATALALGPTLDNGFTNWDDPQYVTENEPLQNVGTRGYGQAIHRVVAGNYHPATMLTLAWDYRRAVARDSADGAELSARPFHATSFALHLAATALVFVFAWLVAGRRPIVATVSAALFGVHPLHVESVAWISARKDVLYAVFYFGALILYLGYRRRRRAWAYGASLVAFALALLSKPSAVVLPITLLLVDDYLDGRLRARSLPDKLPFLAGSLVVGGVTLWTQFRSGALGEAAFDPLQRLLLAGYAFTTYWIKLVAPLELSAFYPYPERLGGVHVAASCVAAALVAVAFVCYRRARVVFFCLGFFAVNLALVLQLVPVGAAIVADRYTYVASVGPFLLAGLGVERLVGSRAGAGKTTRVVAALLCVAAGSGCVWLSRARAAVWADSQTLWSDVIERFPRSAFKAYASRGADHRRRGDLRAARADLDRSIAIAPGYAKAYLTRGNLYRDLAKEQGDPAWLQRSLDDLERAIALSEADPDLYNSRGLTRQYLGRNDEALEDFATALRFDPAHADAYRNRARLQLALGRLAAARRDLGSYHTLRPGDPSGLLMRADVSLAMGDTTAALADFTRCIEAAPRFGDCYLGRAQVHRTLGNAQAARQDAERAAALAAEGAP